ncbi:hypothetical protein HII36_46570 [Nonomuraea sp. NN258]|uniref:hypothetical protein n=1 Tax=Nonomuraea antri TaxID=2730852 RepID=UPI00156997EE|nr:hypothetical protein [Nonomuraea antri]NRQ39237.1 hypothetical protein [Nonomuraea antri]
MIRPRNLINLAAGAAAGYLLAVRPWHLRWGATDREVHAEMAGDDLVRYAQLQATRAIAIAAPPAAVWPWLLHLGGYSRTGSGGTSGAESSSADSTGAGPRDVKVGETLSGEAGGFVVERVEAPHVLVLVARDAEATTSCSIALHADDDGGTRLVYRLRTRAEPGVRGTVHLAATEVGDFLLTRRHLVTVKERAEAAAAAG